MTIKQIIGQHLMIVPEGLEFTPALDKLIEGYHIGNLAIYGENYKNKEQLYDLIIDCQNKSLKYNKGIPLFVATDQEGGWINHLKKGFTLLPSNYAIGKKNKRSLAYLTGSIIAKELFIMGFSINFAPVVDLYINDNNWVIGPRSYGFSPEITVNMAAEFIRAHHDEHILPVIKHYPGLGRAAGDPHLSFITNKADYKTLVKEDLKPFFELLKSYENGVMIGHISVPALVKFMEKKDKKDYKDHYYEPAVLSEIIIKKYLIQHLKCRSLIISDDLNMKAIKRLLPAEEAVYRSLKAGVDIVLINREFPEIKKIVDYLVIKYKEDKDFKRRMQLSLKKILNSKAIIFKKHNRINYLSKRYFYITEFEKNYKSLNEINNESFQKINRYISMEAVDIEKNENNLIPLQGTIGLKNRKVILVSSKYKMLDELKKYIPLKNIFFIKIKPYVFDKFQEKDMAAVLNAVDDRSLVIFSIVDGMQAKIALEVYKKNKNMIIINLLHSGNIKGLPGVKTIISTYSDNEAQIEAAIETLFNGAKNKYSIGNIFPTY